MNSTVYLYVFDTVADWEIGYLTVELNSGRYYKKHTNISSADQGHGLCYYFFIVEVKEGRTAPGTIESPH
ncbi:hypothetical protein SAMN05421736_10179 [Evansella caseinilytica]|uniref:Uncharacterized protein n=1 Tax=Evansella caseinilytica TaxID=1503961 RepID=A0A1H3G6F4_9BACI|nr:hypothetical protein SAMN05421736_10179 [Evansella caseinilytica]